MPVYFGSGGQVDVNTLRNALNTSDGSIRTLAARSGYGTPDYFSDWWNVNFFAYIYLYQEDPGYIWDGCQGRDSWTWYETYDEYGGYVNAWGGGSTYNTERGYNNGSFLTFGYGYSYTYTRPYADIMVAVGSSNDYNCRAFFVDINEDYGYGRGQVASNFFRYNGGYQECRYYSNMGFQNYRYFYGRLFLWY